MLTAMPRPKKPVSQTFNDWWRKNYDKDPSLLYGLLRNRDKCKAKGVTVRIPHSVTLSKTKKRDFRTLLFKYFKLFVKHVDEENYMDLPDEYNPELRVSQLSQRNEATFGVGIYANVDLEEGSTISIDGCCLFVSKPKYEDYVKRGKINLAMSEKNNLFAKGSKGKVFYTVDGAVLYLNHACPPHHNVQVSANWKKLTCLTYIKAGSQLFLDYGDDFFSEDYPCRNPLCHPRSEP